MSRSETFRPLYKTLVDKIELDIIRRNLKTGDFFCVLKDLCDQYQVSIITVRKAVSILEHNGILSCKSASGIYIANRELLNTLNTFERIILIPHHHYIERPNLFFELRLSALLQTLPQKGYGICRIADLPEGFESGEDQSAGAASTWSNWRKQHGRGITASKRRISETDVDQSATRHRSISSSLPVPV